MKNKSRKVVVELDASTWRWLRALARANEKSDMVLNESTPAGILAQAAFCFADAAGRRTGSWESDVGQRMLDSSGFQETVKSFEYERCQRHDDREESEARAQWEAQRAQIKESGKL